jgi:aminoglycoside 6'-N-acetyltransferase
MGIRVQGELTTARPVGTADVDRLVAWHAEPEVARYWDDETYTREELEAKLARPQVDALIVEAGGEPVGYVQVWWDEPGVGGLDMFLVPAARGRGLGPDAARAVARHLIDERGWVRVTVDPYLWNEPAIRAWGRAGFVGVEERDPDEEHTGRWLLMEFRS